MPARHSSSDLREMGIALDRFSVGQAVPDRINSFGLLRFPEDGVPAGAFRIEREPGDRETSQIELEWTDGSA